ncbi:outer membrane lipid asymmetry maintenance prote in MlaD [Desulfonema ishimotonii]|uniref:Outer membrane lipid asymmetry maintenance prote in MlaD n=1 Tax=Desulfonema ishimotonii TaxID=45657 RepID=A0A401G035_9BACT|nr:outer membrane lipid asymmetry maintenance protein MlaD [Desulfonema ishimotonii]GBC62584.1 outer membrane lipid asymmetry maintenance prote in MlaD [Desulfonema ishimotonii]
MNKASVEISVGIFIFIGLVCVSYLTIRLGKMEWIGDNYYVISARFQSVSGLKTGAEVVMSGVEIGRVDALRLDPERLDAIVDMKIQKGLELTDDVIASVKTAGLIGDKYIRLSPGGSDIVLRAGDMITETESAIDLEEMISKYVFGGV